METLKQNFIDTVCSKDDKYSELSKFLIIYFNYFLTDVVSNSFDKLFGEEFKDEMVRVTKPDQYEMLNKQKDGSAPTPIQNIEIIPKGKRFNMVDCAIPSNKDYDMLKTLGTLKECREACINNPGCNGFSRQKEAGETDKAECILKKAFYNDIKICKDSNSHVSYVRDGQIEAERNYRAEQLRIQQQSNLSLQSRAKEPEKKSNKGLIIGLSVGGGVLILATVLFFVLRKKKK
jgi:hypothetical protein